MPSASILTTMHPLPAGDSTPSVLPLIAVEADDGNGIGESGCVERG